MKRTLPVAVLLLLIPLAIFAQTLGLPNAVSNSASSPGSVPGPSKLGAAGTSFTNLRHGITGALSGGTLVVADTGATANTRYFFTTHTLGTVLVAQAYYASARSAGVSFTVTSAGATDTSTVDWLAIEP